MKYKVKHALISMDGASYVYGKFVDASELGEHVDRFLSCGAIELIPEAKDSKQSTPVAAPSAAE